MPKDGGELTFDEQTEEWVYNLNGVELWREWDKEVAEGRMDWIDSLQDGF